MGDERTIYRVERDSQAYAHVPTYELWAEYCYRDMAEAVARREADANPGVAYRVLPIRNGRGYPAVWAGRSSPVSQVSH